MKHRIAALVYPHQLWENNPAVSRSSVVFLIEDPLFFSQYKFHCQKLVLHRASMTEFASYCERLGKKVHRIETNEIAISSDIGSILKDKDIKRVLAVDPTDVWLKERVSQGCESVDVELEWLDDLSFLTPIDVMQRWIENRQHYHFTDFYMQQRKRLGLLLDDSGKPLGGKWTFDTENRKKLPNDIVIPGIVTPIERASVWEAKSYVAKRFPNAIGSVSTFNYPVTYADAKQWLSEFVEARLAFFGDFEDAISQRETFVFHSVLTPMLNIGLLTPQQIVDAVLRKCEEVSLNSLEGFLRQVIGWREFVRLVYLACWLSSENSKFLGSISYSYQTPFTTGRPGLFPLTRAFNAS